MGWTEHMRRMAEATCYDCATRNGHTVEDTENCDNGSVGCPDCPFKRKENNNAQT